MLLLEGVSFGMGSVLGNRLSIAAIVLLMMGKMLFADIPADVSQLQAELDTGDFRGAVLGAGKLLDLSGPAGAQVDRGLVLSIKAEGYLQLQNYQLAADTFARAAKEEGDPDRAAIDRATEILIRRSSTGTYLPQVGEEDGAKPLPIDIGERTARPAAFPILFKDEWAAAQPELMQSQSTQDLGLLLKTLEKASVLNQLERAAKGRADQTRQPLQTLSQHAYDLMAGTLNEENKRVTQDKTEAEKKVHTQGPGFISDGSRRSDYSPTAPHIRTAGLSSRISRDLRAIISDCSQIAPAAESIGGIAQVPKKWSPIIAQAQRISGRAEDVLDADYDTAEKHGETVLGR